MALFAPLTYCRPEATATRACSGVEGQHLVTALERFVEAVVREKVGTALNKKVITNTNKGTYHLSYTIHAHTDVFIFPEFPKDNNLAGHELVVAQNKPHRRQFFY